MAQATDVKNFQPVDRQTSIATNWSAGTALAEWDQIEWVTQVEPPAHWTLILRLNEVVRLALKRGLDLIVATSGLICALPIVTILAALIKLDSPGPVFFVQERVGKDGRSFMLYKLRSMREDAEAATGPVWAMANDPRITRIGSFLRRSHLDELPQLWNVLKGEMSTVGPRPERPYFVDELSNIIPKYRGRLAVKPGVTGLAQIRYRYDTTIEDVKHKLAYDLLYVKNRCLLLDARILFRTVSLVLRKQWSVA